MRPAVTFAGLSAIALLWGCGLVGFKYPKVVDNQPLRAPVRVISVTPPDLLTLQDGRRVRLDSTDPLLSRKLQESDLEVEVIPLGSEPDGTVRAEVFVKQPSHLPFCGTPWAQPIRLPLFADVFPRWVRHKLGTEGEREHDALPDGTRPP